MRTGATENPILCECGNLHLRLFRRQLGDVVAIKCWSIERVASYYLLDHGFCWTMQQFVSLERGQLLL